MPFTNPDENWPFCEQFSPDHAADHLEQLIRLPLLESIKLRLEKVAMDYTKVSFEPVDFLLPNGELGVTVLETVVETTASQALRTSLERNHDAVAIHVDSRTVAPAKPGLLFAEAAVTKKDRGLAQVDVAVEGEGGSIVARGRCMLRVSRRPDPWLPPVPPSCELFEGGLGI